MTEQLRVTTERVDDIPILVTQSQMMGIPEVLDSYFKPHGNWEGISLGWTTTIWLAHILSEGDHRMNQVQPWVAHRLQHRLAIVLDALSDDQTWQQFETALNQRIIGVYQLKPQRMRLDSTTASRYWTVSEAGLFQFGESSDHRPDLPQLKVMLAALDPLGLPRASQVVAGEAADDPLYLPAVRQVSQSLQEHGLLYVGDCKMAALSTRAWLHAQGDYYLTPLVSKQLPESVLDAYLQPVWAGERSLVPVYRSKPEEEPELIAQGYEQTVVLTCEVDGQLITWSERQLIVRSQKLAQTSQAALQARLVKAQAALQQLNEHRQGKKGYQDADSLPQAAQAILKQHRVQGLFTLRIDERVAERPVRAYGSHPATVRVERAVRLHFAVDVAAVTAVMRRFGWRVYATNHPQETLELAQAVLAYREEYLVECGFGRLKGKPLSLWPMYVQSDRRATGLVRLLSIGLRVLTLLEFRARHHLAQRQESLPGLYVGNPKRTTSRPTAEALLQAFEHIHLSVVTFGSQLHRHITPLSELQKRILALWDLSPTLYDQLSSAFLEPS